MPWFYVDDGFSDSKPVLNMPDRHRLAACGLWVLAGSWSAKEESDGFVPDSKLKLLGARPSLIDVLTEDGPLSAPLCVKVSAGIQFRSWEKWQKTREELIEKRREAAARQRKSRSRKSKGRNAVTSDEGEASQSDSHVTDSVTDAYSHDDVTRDPHACAHRPDPTRPLVDNLGVCSPVGSTADPAHTSRPPETCPDHPAGTTQNCGPCANHRRVAEAWDADNERVEADQLDARRRQRQADKDAISACILCDENGMREISDAMIRCDHQAAAHA